MNKKILLKSLLGIAGVSIIPATVAIATSCNSNDVVEGIPEGPDAFEKIAFATDNIIHKTSNYDANSEAAGIIPESYFDVLDKNAGYLLQTIAYNLASALNFENINITYTTKLSGNSIKFDVIGNFNLNQKKYEITAPICYVLKKGVYSDGTAIANPAYKERYSLKIDFNIKCNDKVIDINTITNNKGKEIVKNMVLTSKEMENVFTTLLASKFINVNVENTASSVSKTIQDDFNSERLNQIGRQTFINFFKFFLVDQDNSNINSTNEPNLMPKPDYGFNSDWFKKSFFTNTKISLKNTNLTFKNEIEIRDISDLENNKPQRYISLFDINLEKNNDGKYVVKHQVKGEDGNLIADKTFEKSLTQDEFDQLMTYIG